MDNFREVMNVCAALMCQDDTLHVKLADTHGSLAAAGDDAGAIAKQPGQSVGFQIDVDGYGTGRVGFLARG